MNVNHNVVEQYQLQKVPNQNVDSYYGLIQGYYTILDFEESYTNLRIGATIANNDKTDFESNLSLVAGVNNVVISEHVLKVVITDDKELENVIQTVYAKLVNHAVPTGGFITGEDNGDVALYENDSEFYFQSDKAIKRLNKDEEIKTQPKSYSKGFLGAFIGALIGAIIWGILLYFNWYGWFAAIIGVTLSFALYRRFGGPVTLQGAIGIILIQIILLVLANRLVWSMIVQADLNYIFGGFSFFDVFMNLGFYMDELDAALLAIGEYYSYNQYYNIDLWLGIGISLVVGLLSFIPAYREAKAEEQA